jgi:hypothetical protein
VVAAMASLRCNGCIKLVVCLCATCSSDVWIVWLAHVAATPLLAALCAVVM